MMNFTALTLKVDGGVASITLTQPEIRNAFSDVVIAEITAAFAAAGARPDVRAVVLAAEGPAFCAGANLNWMRRMAEYSRDENRDDAGLLAEMLRTIYECPKPTIARVQGDVYAGGMGLVACCDMAVAADTAGFCLSEVKIGLIPATISPYVIRAMGPRAAHRYFLTGERFSAAEAHRTGFVHEVVPAGQLDTVVDGWLKNLLAAGPEAVRACKRLVIDVAEREINEQLIAATVEGIADIRASSEGKEGVQAFLNKRKPNWLPG
ncbi:enoyl-CoA hydratase [Comamonas phosphati]|nr:enoyl-CoA hydratase [Comamonas phosphati]